VSALLASVPVPPMPDHLTERVSAAIAAEAEQRAAGFNAVRAGRLPASSPGTDVGTVEGADGSDDAGVPEIADPVEVPGRPDLPHRPRRRTRSRRTWTSPLVLGGLATAGVFAFVVAGAVVVLNQAQVGSSSGTAGAGRAGAPSVPRPKSLGRNSAFGPNVNGPNSAPTGVQVKYKASGRTRTTTAYTSQAHFTSGNIARGVRSEVVAGLRLSGPEYRGGITASGAAHTPVPSPSSQHRQHRAQPHKVGSLSVVRIEGCLSAVAPSNGVFLVEIAHYQGKPAIIIIGKPVANAYPVTVTGLACSSTAPDVLARITVPKRR
jgi:hypothetical protein